MPGTFTKLLFHVVFATKGRARMITPDIEPRLYEYLGGIVNSLNASPLRIGGYENHVHMLIRLRPSMDLSEIMRVVKSRSSRWVHESFPLHAAFRWQESYSAFTVSHSLSETVERYIAKQHEHHRTRTYEEELLALLRLNAVEYDERYLWD